MIRKVGAEFFGTFWLVFGGCGSAVLAAGVKDVGIGWLGVALAFGLTVLTMAYAVGHISGGHFNPAVSLGLWAGKRFDAKELAPYIATQIVAAIAAAGAQISGRADVPHLSGRGASTSTASVRISASLATSSRCDWSDCFVPSTVMVWTVQEPWNGRRMTSMNATNTQCLPSSPSSVPFASHESSTACVVP